MPIMSTAEVDYTVLLTAVPAFFAIFTGTIVFTPKDAFLTRLSAIVALVAIHWQIHLQLLNALPTAALRDACTMISWGGCWSATEMVLISRVAAEDLTVKGEKKRDVGTGTLLYRASCLYFNLRRVGTKWEIKDLTYVRPKSHIGFVAYKLCTMTFAYLLVDATASGPPPDPEMVSEEKETLWRLGNLSTEDVITRLAMVTVFWIMGYTVNYLINNTGALITVALGISKPSSWPRTNSGPLSSLTSVRGFWSVFWHQQVRKLLSGWGDAISDNVLCLRRGTLLSRYTRLFLAFFISGVLHHVHDMTWGVPHSKLSSVVFFSMQALGIMFEDAVQAVTKSWGIPQRVRSVVGFFWLWAFLWWTTPRWFYPTVRGGEDGALFPFSVTRYLLS